MSDNGAQLSFVSYGKALPKRYRIGEGASATFFALRDASSPAAFRSPVELSFFVAAVAQHETLWALKDVSLDVREGEVLGLIGRNGAGKTTLLKILSRITRPTAGWAEFMAVSARYSKSAPASIPS